MWIHVQFHSLVPTCTYPAPTWMSISAVGNKKDTKNRRGPAQLYLHRPLFNQDACTSWPNHFYLAGASMLEKRNPC